MLDQQFEGAHYTQKKTCQTDTHKALWDRGPGAALGISWSLVQGESSCDDFPLLRGDPVATWGSLGVPGKTSRKMLTEPPLFNSCASREEAYYMTRSKGG